MKRLVPLLVLIPVGILVLGYLFRPPPEVKEERTAVQESILVYTDLTQPLGETMRAFELAWEEAHQSKDRAQLRDALKTKALPVLTILTDSLKAAAPQNEELNQIHQPLLEGYEEALDSLKLACSEEDASRFADAHKGVISKLESLLDKHTTYEQRIRGFYQVHNVYPKEKEGTEPSREGEVKSIVPPVPGTGQAREEASP